MAKGKYSKRNHTKKSMALMVSVLLILMLSVGGILAYLTTVSSPVMNTFKPTEVTTEVTETRSGSTKSNVQIKNTGDVTAWIRASIIVTWQNEAGEIYGKAPEYGVDYTMSKLASGWTQGDDGFLYYTSPVEPEDSTGVMYAEIKSVEGKNPEGYYLTVEIIGSGIQHKPAKVFNENWAASSGLNANAECTALS